MRVPRHKKPESLDDANPPEPGDSHPLDPRTGQWSGTADTDFDEEQGAASADLRPASGPGQLDDDLAARMRPSKTQLKKAMHELQALGEALVALPASRTETLDLSETLRIALRDYRQTKTHEGRRRQMQYIGKLMRYTDADPIRQTVAAMQLGSAKETLALHKAERLRIELIDSDDALTRWLEDHPQTDVQQMRSLIRAARKDAASAPEQRNGRAYRELFQLIKQHQSDDAGGTDERDE